MYAATQYKNISTFLLLFTIYVILGRSFVYTRRRLTVDAAAAALDTVYIFFLHLLLARSMLSRMSSKLQKQQQQKKN